MQKIFGTWKEKGCISFFYQNLSLYSDYINLQNPINCYYHSQGIKLKNKQVSTNHWNPDSNFWWFETIFILGQLGKCGWNPSPGFDEVQSGVDISSWVIQPRFFQLGHFKRKSNLTASILNWLMQIHITLMLYIILGNYPWQCYYFFLYKKLMTLRILIAYCTVFIIQVYSSWSRNWCITDMD